MAAVNKWRRIEYFVTGATGLIGAHVVRELIGEGHDVVALTRSRSNASHLPEGLSLVVVQPGAVYGPHDELYGSARAAFRDYLTGDLPVIPRDFTLPFGCAEDAARAHVRAMEDGHSEYLAREIDQLGLDVDVERTAPQSAPSP